MKLTATVLGVTACWLRPFEGSCYYHLRPNYREKTQPHISQKTGLKIYWAWPAQLSKTQFSPQPVPPIRKLPQASYPLPPEGRQKENHNHRIGIKLITWITALSNSVKLWAMPCRVTQDGQVMVESSDKMWATGGNKNGKPHQHFCLENPMNSMKRQKDMTLKDEFFRSVVPNMLLENSGEIVQERMKRLSQSGNNFQLWMCLVMKVKSNAVKKNPA